MNDDSNMEFVRKRLNELMKVAVYLSVQFCCLGVFIFFLPQGKNKHKYWASSSNMTRGDVQSRKSIYQGVYKYGSTCIFACLPVDVYLYIYSHKRRHTNSLSLSHDIIHLIIH